MLDFTKTTKPLADNTVVINNQVTFNFTDEQMQLVFDYIEKVNNGTAVKNTGKTPNKQFCFADDCKFAIVGDYFMIYKYNDKLYTRYWELAYTNDKIKYALKMSLKDVAKWDKDLSAFEFKSEEAYDNWRQVQIGRGSKIQAWAK